MMKTGTASSIRTNLWKSAEYEEQGTIMKTDIFIKLVSDAHTEEEMILDIRESFRTFRAFADRFTRFDEQSELSRFNASRGGKVSPELFLLLRECRRFYELTEGVFDPSILPVLIRIGYEGGSDIQSPASEQRDSFGQLIFDEAGCIVRKPENVLIDLGGIGKGYIVDRVADELSKKYANGIVDAGGDMRIFGSDRERNLEHWVIDVENPLDASQSLVTLLLTDCAVATSGTSRKHWQKEGQAYHHLIDPLYGTSAETGITQVTVIALRATEADVFAKMLFILGPERGQAFASEKNIPALFVTEDKKVIRNPLFEKYEWKA